MKRSVLWVSSLLTLAAACGGRSTDALEDEAPDEPIQGAGGTSGGGGSGGAPGTAGWGGGGATAGSGGAPGTAGSAGAEGPAGAAGTANTTTPTGTGRTGEDLPCLSDVDCAGYQANFCDVFVTNTCMVRGCRVAPDSCSAGKQCCDLSAFGLPTLCLAAGVCQN